ncbi:MAG: PorV/PorQ family protein [Candidatus Cloacimonadota bacterium]|nr:PorV/PorQ family protein [Candidatus Cloacimonadota bacterium]
MNLKKIICLAVALLLFQTLFGIYSDAGTRSFTFLKVPIGPRAAGMSNAYFGLSNDELAPFWNPAGLAQIKCKKYGVTYLNYIDSYNGGAASCVLPISNISAVAFFAKFVGAGDFDKTEIDESGGIIDLGTFGSYDVMLGVSYGKVISDIIDIGFSFKFITESIDDYSSQAIAGDVAIMHQTPNPKLKIGLGVKNFGKQISQFDSKEEKLPLLLAGGIRYDIPDGHLALDINKPADNDVYGNLGVEKKVRDNLTLRAGYRTNASDFNVGSSIDFLSGISAGFGFKWKNYMFNYAINSWGELGFINQLSVGRNF